MEDDPDDPRPLYVRVATEIRAAIQSGEYAVGDKLPSYAEIGAQFGVSHMTVKQAISVLKAENAVTPRKGMGVFVRTADVGRGGGNFEDLQGRLEDLEARVHAIEAATSTLNKP